jgi:hypothetical protein
MKGNGGGMCSGTVAMSLCGGTKGACRHISTQVSNGTEKECVESVVKSESYLEGEAMSPRHTLGITVFRSCDV